MLSTDCCGVLSPACRERLKQARADLASATRREQELRRTLEQKEKRLADIEASTEDTQKKVRARKALCSCSALDVQASRLLPLSRCQVLVCNEQRYTRKVCAQPKHLYAADSRYRPETILSMPNKPRFLS